MTNEITLGSGKLYGAAFTAGTAITSLSTYAVAANQLGWIQGGASISYTPKVYEVKDDMNAVYKRFIIGEEASLKSGILTWDLAAIDKFIGNKSYTTDTTTGVKTMKLGGKGAREMDEYIIVFEHEKKDGTKLYLGLVGTNDAGLAFDFQPEKENVIDAEFRAINNDSNGCLLIIQEVPAPTGNTGATGDTGN